MQLKDLTVVIVTFKSQKNIHSCLDSIPKDINVLVIENSNNEKFKLDLEKKYSNVECIIIGSNKGYAAGNNIGLRKVKTKFALILNPDTKLRKDTIDNFLLTASNNNDFWLMGPYNDQQKNLSFNSNNVIEVNNLKGFAIFFNLMKFNEIYFDENFFLYFEEIDLCKQVKIKGGKILVDKNIIINHDGASSVENIKKIELEKNRNWHWMWSTFYYNKKYKGFLIALILIMPKLISSIAKTLFFLIIFNKKKRDIYFCRMSGIINSILGKKSWYRPSLDWFINSKKIKNHQWEKKE